MASRLPTYPTIPHTRVLPSERLSWFFSGCYSAVHHAPQLTLGHFRRPEPAVPEFGRDHRPYLVILEIAIPQFAVPSYHELRDGLLEIRRDVRHDARRGRLGQSGRDRDVADQIPRVRIVHDGDQFGSPSRVRATFLPGIGQEWGAYSPERASLPGLDRFLRRFAQHPGPAGSRTPAADLSNAHSTCSRRAKCAFGSLRPRSSRSWKWRRI